MANEDLAGKLSATEWGAAFLREMDLTIAANVLQTDLEGRSTLYNAVLEKRVGYRCRGLDPDVVDDFRGVIPIVANEEQPWRSVDDATAFLKDLPRGTWAVFSMDGAYEAYMSDGFGNLGTTDGNQFMYTKATAPAFNFEDLYASLWASTIYYRRDRITNEIRKHSAQVNLPEVGAVVEGQYVKGKRWKKLVYAGLGSDPNGGGTPHDVDATRPGVRKVRFGMVAESLHSLFRMPYEMPEAYGDDENPARLRTLEERRIANAKAVSEYRCEEIEGLDPKLNGREFYYFRKDGDTYTHPLYHSGDTVPDATGQIVVEFAPGGIEPIDWSYVDKRASSPRP